MGIKSGIMVWKGDAGRPKNHYSRTKVEGVTADAALATLQTGLATHTLCNPAARLFTDRTAGTDTAPAAEADIDVKGVIYFRNPTTAHIVRMELPAPVAEDIELIAEGHRYTAVALAAILELVNAAIGQTYVALWGKQVERT